MNVLHQKQRDLHNGEQNLIQDIPTTWNSSFYLVEHILKQQLPLHADCLRYIKQNYMPSDVEITAMETFLVVMQPFVQITELMGAKKWVTLSEVRPLLYKIINKHLVDAPSDSRLKRVLKKAIPNDLKTCNTDPSAAALIDKACFHDPRLKTLPFLSEANRKEIISNIQEEADLKESIDQEPLEKWQRKEGGLMTVLEDICEPTRKAAYREVEKYWCIDSCSESSDRNSLSWWMIHSSRFWQS